MAKKDDNIILECMGGLKSLIRHRKGLKILGKELNQLKLGKFTVHIDNEIPGIIEDTFDNLGFITKDNRKPLCKVKARTDYGWFLKYNLPPGISYKQVKLKENFFSDAVKGFVAITWDGGMLIMDIQVTGLPTYIPYSWDPTPYEKMDLAIPIGYTAKGIEVFDLTSAPHMFIAGQTGFGKTMALHCIANALIPQAYVFIIDPKRLDFNYLKDHVCLARTDDEAFDLFKLLNKEYDRRIDILEKAEVLKIQEYKGDDMPYIVVIVDEIAELDKDIHPLMNRLLRLARATGISIIGATQRPSVKVIDGDTRELFEARLVFKVSNEVSSRMILGEENSMAAWLPIIKGRAIWKFGHELKEVQTMCITPKDRKKLLETHPKRRWELESDFKRLKPN